MTQVCISEKQSTCDLRDEFTIQKYAMLFNDSPVSNISVRTINLKAEFKDCNAKKYGFSFGFEIKTTSGWTQKRLIEEYFHLSK